MVHRRPVLAADPGKHGEHRLGGQVLLQLSFPGIRRPRELPDMQLPLARRAEHHLVVTAQAWAYRPCRSVLLIEIIVEHAEHGLGFERVGVRRDDRGKLQHRVADAGHLGLGQVLQVIDQRGHLSVVQDVVGHQHAQRFAFRADALANRPGQRFLGERIAIDARAVDVGQIRIVTTAHARVEQKLPGDRRNKAAPFGRAQAAAPVAA